MELVLCAAGWWNNEMYWASINFWLIKLPDHPVLDKFFYYVCIHLQGWSELSAWLYRSGEEGAKIDCGGWEWPSRSQVRKAVHSQDKPMGPIGPFQREERRTISGPLWKRPFFLLNSNYKCEQLMWNNFNWSVYWSFLFAGSGFGCLWECKVFSTCDGKTWCWHGSFWIYR